MYDLVSYFFIRYRITHYNLFNSSELDVCVLERLCVLYWFYCLRFTSESILALWSVSNGCGCALDVAVTVAETWAKCDFSVRVCCTVGACCVCFVCNKNKTNINSGQQLQAGCCFFLCGYFDSSSINSELRTNIAMYGFWAWTEYITAVKYVELWSAGKSYSTLTIWNM